MHECKFTSAEVPLAAINRLILPPSELIANQEKEIFAGRDFRAGYKGTACPCFPLTQGCSIIRKTVSLIRSSVGCHGFVK
eukprot:scaffold7858_cov47-Prasinocladus_malaysianus.AAC.1